MQEALRMLRRPKGLLRRLQTAEVGLGCAKPRLREGLLRGPGPRLVQRGLLYLPVLGRRTRRARGRLRSVHHARGRSSGQVWDLLWSLGAAARV